MDGYELNSEQMGYPNSFATEENHAKRHGKKKKKTTKKNREQIVFWKYYT
jgi:hypothetical protein